MTFQKGCERHPDSGWKKGHRRNKDRGDWGHVRLSLTVLLNEHGEPGVISQRALGATLGVDGKTVHKWVTGVNRPDEEMQGLIAEWIKQRKDEIKRRKGK